MMIYQRITHIQSRTLIQVTVTAIIPDGEYYSPVIVLEALIRMVMPTRMMKLLVLIIQTAYGHAANQYLRMRIQM